MSIFEMLLFLVLVVVAIGVGWALGRWQGSRELRRQNYLANHYFRGLNYLLNEEPDKAIEIFLQLAERKPSPAYRIGRQASHDVIETHLALGSLFRRRGEMDKAIRFHKHIIAQPHLNEAQRTQALRELGRDYLQAGLLDRAERLFSELIEREQDDAQPTRQLIDIYQQEKDWVKAIEQAQHLQTQEPDESNFLLAQYNCELAEQALARGDTDGATKALRQAKRYKPGHPRALILSGDMARLAGDHAGAIDEYIKACQADSEVFVLLDELMLKAHEQLDRVDEFIEWLSDFWSTSQLSAALISLATLQAKKNPQAGVQTLLDGLEKRATINGLEALVHILHQHDMSLAEVDPELVGRLMQELRNAQARYRCRQCGFSSSEHHWLCPSCRHWGTTRLVQGPWGD